MGEAKQRSLSKSQILKLAERCIYCAESEGLTVEHMPPRGLFKDKSRPSGWEFACCQRCNSGTSAADALAQFFAKTEMFGGEDWKVNSMLKLQNIIERLQPGVMSELFDERRWRDVYGKRNGLLHRLRISRVNGPKTTRLMNIFCAKMAMASFATLTGRPLDMDGLIFTEWFLNAGIDQELYDAITTIMPGTGKLEQGTKNSEGQFQFRFNSDRSSAVAALLSFHSGLHITVIATDNAELVQPLAEKLHGQNLNERPTAHVTRPGLADVLPIR